HCETCERTICSTGCFSSDSAANCSLSSRFIGATILSGDWSPDRAAAQELPSRRENLAQVTSRMKIASMAIIASENHGSPINTAIPTWKDPIPNSAMIRVGLLSSIIGKHICRIIELQEMTATIGPQAVNSSLNSGQGPNRWVCRGL